jgi:hypothetical protein
MRIKRIRLLVMLILSMAWGCGSVSPESFAHRLLDTNGQTILLEDVERIVGDASLTDDEKRAELRGLGIEDEKLMAALLDL